MLQGILTLITPATKGTKRVVPVPDQVRDDGFGIQFFSGSLLSQE
jgi:hypothetical protein